MKKLFILYLVLFPFLLSAQPCVISLVDTVSNVIISGTANYQAFNTLIVGPSVTITGDATFIAGNEVILLGILEVASGANVDVLVGPNEPSRCFSGRCIAAGQNICEFCPGCLVPITIWATTGGICNIFVSFATVSCESNSVVTSATDVSIR